MKKKHNLHSNKLAAMYEEAVLVFLVCVLNAAAGCNVRIDVTGIPSGEVVYSNTELESQITDLRQRLGDVETVMKSRDCTNVAFTARKLDRVTLTDPNLTVKFESVILNAGEGYNSSTGLFTAPVNGTYVFSWTITTKQFLATGSGLYVNGTYEIARTWADAREVKRIQDNAGSNTVSVQLKRGDNVRINLKPDFGHLFVEGDLWSTFSGWKIGCP